MEARGWGSRRDGEDIDRDVSRGAMNKQETRRPSKTLPGTFYGLAVSQGSADVGGTMTYFTLVTWILSGRLLGASTRAAITWGILLLNIGGVTPAILLGSIAGVWADRYDRSRLVFVSCLADLAVLMALGLFIGAHSLSPVLSVTRAGA
jgi:hypothetical protein